MLPKSRIFLMKSGTNSSRECLGLRRSRVICCEVLLVACLEKSKTSVGEPNSGKGTITEVFRLVFASQFNTVDAKDFCAKKSDGNIIMFIQAKHTMVYAKNTVSPRTFCGSLLCKHFRSMRVFFVGFDESQKFIIKPTACPWFSRKPPAVTQHSPRASPTQSSSAPWASSGVSATGPR